MDKIVVIGNSAAGFRCAEALARLGPSFDITVVSSEEGPAYRRDALLELLDGTKKEKDLYLVSADEYAALKISLVSGREVSRVDTKRQRVVLKDNSRIAYEWLVIASGQGPAELTIPGKHKEGVFCAYTLKDFREMGKRLDIVHTACLIGPALRCAAFSRVLLAKGKEVKIIGCGKPEEEPASEQCEWIPDALPCEIIGEGSELKALKLSNGKVIGTSLVVFLETATPSAGFLKDSGIAVDQGYVVTDGNLRTNVENVYACGAVAMPAGRNMSWQDAEAEGLKLAGILIQAYEGRKAVCPQTS